MRKAQRRVDFDEPTKQATRSLTSHHLYCSPESLRLLISEAAGERHRQRHHLIIRIMAIGLSAILTAVWNIKHYVPSVNNRSVRITRPRLRTDGTSSNNTNKDNESITDLVNETLLEDMLMKDESEASKPGDMSLEAIESIDDTTEITPSDSIPSISPSSPRRSWCVISNKSMWPSVDSWGWRKSVPHSAEALLPCWSWFVETNSTTNCGFYVMDNLKEPHSWARQLMDNMGCKVKYSNFSSSWNMTTTSLLEQEDEVKVWREFPFQECYWFKNQKHVRILKELVLLNDDGQNLDIMSLSSQLNIGLVNRTGTRQIENLSALRDGIEDALKEQGAVSISIQLLDSLTLQQQAKWFASQHIIIGTFDEKMALVVLMIHR